MRRETRITLFMHLVWSTWDRLPLLTEDVRRHVYRVISAKCQELGAEVIAIGGVEDHVHLLVRLPPTLAVADLMKHVKGTSSHLVTHEVAPGRFFKWQGAYGACTVCPRHLTGVSKYIARQKERHAAGALLDQLEPEPIVRPESP